MIGYDRPLRPEWIKKVHEIWEPNKLLADFKEPFDQIAWQVEGDEARRKARTVLFRYFLAHQGQGNARRTLEKDPLVEISNRYSLEDLKALYLAVLIAEVEVIQKIVEILASRYGLGDIIEVSEFIRLIKREFGDRDVIRRSVSSFFKTLYYFGIFEVKEKSSFSSYEFIDKLGIKEDLFHVVFTSLFVSGRKRKQFELNEIRDDHFWIFFYNDNLEDLIKRFNNIHWTLSKKVGYERLTFVCNQ